MTRLLVVVAVLLVCSMWPYLAKAETKPEDEDDNAWIENINKSARNIYVPKRPPTVYFASDVPDAMALVEVAREELKLATSAWNLAKGAADTSNSNESFNATAEVLKSRARAEKVVSSLNSDVQATSLFSKMAAKVAQELYDNDAAVALLTEEHQKWFTERYGSATAQEPNMTEAITKMQAAKRGFPGMHPLVAAVMTPAKSMYTLAHDASNDAKYVAYRRVSTEILAERIESLQELVKTEKATESSSSCLDKKESNATPVSEYRDTAAKAYLSAVSAQKIAASCVTRIKGNTTLFNATYYELRALLAKIGVQDYAEMQVYQKIADNAHADAKECEEIAAGTPENAERYVETAKKHLNKIASCVNAVEAQWRASEAQKASQLAVDEMQYALHQLFRLTVSLQQVTDAQKAVADSKALQNAQEDEKKFLALPKDMPTAPKVETETETEKEDPKRPHMMRIREKTEDEKTAERGAVREAKKEALASESDAETSYDAVKAHASKAASTMYYLTEIVNRVKEGAAQVSAGTTDKKKEQIKEILAKAQKALQSANESSNTAQAAAEAVYKNYNSTKNAVDYALHWFETTIVAHWQKNATETAKIAKNLLSTETQKAKDALDNVQKEQAEALAAYEEMSELVGDVKKADGLSTMKLRTERVSERDSATTSSPLHASMGVLCAMAVLVLGTV